MFSINYIVTGDTYRKLSQIVFSQGRVLFIFTIVVSCLLYIAVYVQTPLSVWVTAGHDDGLFIRLGQSLARGRWLGHYSQYTLMKGPGYPAFLAVGSWLGLSVSFMHAFFHCTTVVIFTWVIEKISRSRLLAISVFLVVLWHPGVFIIERVIRDQIYPGQVLLCLALFSYSLFVADQRAKRVLGGVLAGVALGWFWLTREEGIWILPGIGLLILFAFVRVWRKQATIQKVLVPAAAVVLMFISTQFVFQVLNWVAYGEFVGVDIKEKNFKAAMAALQSVQVGTPKPYIPVSLATRERIYSVSPAFTTLKQYLDPPGGSGWTKHGCIHYPSTCGDIAGGWFMWALRDAASLKGYYQSPAKASEFFGTVASEIKAACEDSRLSCNESLNSYMPHITRDQVGNISAKIGNAIGLLSFKNSQNPANRPSWGTEESLSHALAFLNHPRHFPLPNHRKGEAVFQGWYYDKEKGNEWFGINIIRPDNSYFNYSLERRTSPDLVKHFNDPEANQQRFTIKTACGKECSLLVSGIDGETVRVGIGNIIDGRNRSLTVGSGQLYFDTATITTSKAIKSSNHRAKVWYIVGVVFHGYRIAFPVLLSIGSLAFIGAVALAVKMRTNRVLLALAGACWVLIATRIVIVVLIDISSFPAINYTYLLPALGLASVAALLSIGELISIVLRLKNKLLSKVI